MPEYHFSEPKEGEEVLLWNHGAFRKNNSCGATEGQAEAGCARTAFLTALRVYSASDEGVEGHVRETWSDWVEWSGLGRRVHKLNTCSSLAKVHKLVGLKGDTLMLPMTRLGRFYLFEAGIRSILIRPVSTGRGWVRHCLTLTASDSGDWSLHDPTVEDGILLLGGLPGVARLEGAYVLSVRPRGGSHRAMYTSGGPPSKKKKTARDSIPDPPSESAAQDYLVCTMVDRAFESFAFHCGLPANRLPRARCETLPLKVRERRALPPFRLWQMLAKEHIAPDLHYDAYDTDVLFEYPPSVLRFFLVGGVCADYAQPGLTGLYLVRVTNCVVEIFCPGRKSFQRYKKGKPSLRWCQAITWG